MYKLYWMHSSTLMSIIVFIQQCLKGKSCPRILGRIQHEHTAGFMEGCLGNLAASQNDRA